MLGDITGYFANFNGTTNICRTIALWVSITLLVGFVATKLYIAVIAHRGKSGESAIAAATKLVNGSWIIIALITAVAFIVTFASCYFVDVVNDKDDLFPILFYPLLVLLLAVVASGITLFVKPTKLAKIVCAAVCGGALIAVIVCMIVYYASGDAVENNWGTDVLNNIGLYLSGGVLAAGVVVFAVLSDKGGKPMDTRTITFAAVCVALSFALSYVRILKMPMGGSITFASMLPLMLFAFMFGPRKGVLAGAIYGVLQAVQDPWIIHPAQFALDYLVAFAAIGLAGTIRSLGLFKDNMRAQFALGAVIACGIRFISHYFAGVFAFGVYGEGFAADYGISALANPYFYSFVYQSLYVIPELIIVLAAGMLVMASASFRRQIAIYSAYGDKPQAQKDERDGLAGSTENSSEEYEKTVD